MIDRAVHTAVLDFLDFYVGSFRWPAFNAADSFITVGAVLLILDSLFSRGPSSLEWDNMTDRRPLRIGAMFIGNA